jgi:hypothetical protein
MKMFIAPILSSLALALGTIAEAAVVLDTVAAPPQVEAGVPSSESKSDFGILPGRWMRPDGGYVITIKSVDATGKLDATYANPSPLPFAKAEAIRDGKSLKLFFELRAGGYNGSTYTLIYDPLNDVLKGVYFQAVLQQKFDVYFTRAK